MAGEDIIGNILGGGTNIDITQTQFREGLLSPVSKKVYFVNSDETISRNFKKILIKNDITGKTDIPAHDVKIEKGQKIIESDTNAEIPGIIGVVFREPFLTLERDYVLNPESEYDRGIIAACEKIGIPIEEKDGKQLVQLNHPNIPLEHYLNSIKEDALRQSIGITYSDKTSSFFPKGKNGVGIVGMGLLYDGRFWSVEEMRTDPKKRYSILVNTLLKEEKNEGLVELVQRYDPSLTPERILELASSDFSKDDEERAMVHFLLLLGKISRDWKLTGNFNREHGCINLDELCEHSASRYGLNNNGEPRVQGYTYHKIWKTKEKIPLAKEGEKKQIIEKEHSWLYLADALSTNRSIIKIKGKNKQEMINMLKAEQELDKKYKIFVRDNSDESIIPYIKETDEGVEISLTGTSPISHVPILDLNNPRRQMAVVYVGSPSERRSKLIFTNYAIK